MTDTPDALTKMLENVKRYIDETHVHSHLPALVRMLQISLGRLHWIADQYDCTPGIAERIRYELDHLNAIAEKVVGPNVPSIQEALRQSHAAGGNAWDAIPDPEAYLGRGPSKPESEVPGG